MYLHDLIDRADLSAAVLDRLVTIRTADDGQRILNYTDAAMWTPGAWDNPAVRQCRGLIIDADEKIVARPWAKFFNHGQKEAGALDLDAPVEVTDKQDGSLGIIHLDGSGRPRVATRGSFQSDQAIHATARLLEADYFLDLPDGITPLVEIVYPGNRIVCDYGAMDELVLLGGVNIETGTYYGPGIMADLMGWTGPITQTFPYTTLAEALAAEPRHGAEGMCVRYLREPRIVKIKQDDYIALHRIVTGLSERTVWEQMLAGADVTDVLAGIPDELHEWVKSVWGRLDSDASRILADAHRKHETILNLLAASGTLARRDYAERAKRHGYLTPFLFNLLDGRDPRPAILKTLRPAGDTRALNRTEDVA